MLSYITKKGYFIFQIYHSRFLNSDSTSNYNYYGQSFHLQLILPGSAAEGPAGIRADGGTPPHGTCLPLMTKPAPGRT